jgi:hypothetical protein
MSQQTTWHYIPEDGTLQSYLHLQSPETGISSKAMSITNSSVNDIFEQIKAEASKLAHCS